MAWLVLAAIIAVPVVEIALFIQSAHWIGILPTIALAIGAGILGMALLRRQGLEVLLRTRAQMDRGEVPMGEVFDGVCLALAGVLLVLPGFLSDVVALALLLPPVRLALRGLLLARMTVHGAPAHSGPQVIEAEYKVVDGDK